MKRCTQCLQEKPAETFHLHGKGKRSSVCASCTSVTAAWPAAAYRKAQRFSAAEEYMIRKLAERPSLAAGLDNLYRRNPIRWHQVVAAAMLTKKEQAAT